MNDILITVDSKGDIRYLKIAYILLDDDNYKIIRSTGKLGGKDVAQPPLLIKEGKAKRTKLEQVTLEYNSLITKAKSKGYKNLSEYTTKSFDEVTKEDIDIEGVKTDSQGVKKPMLAKDTENAKPAIWNRYWRISRKLDGVRCLLYWNEEKQEVCSASRGGKTYDASIEHIRKNDKLRRLLKKHPNMMLDGEIYVHGMSLHEISGIARLKEFVKERCEPLQFHCYDIAIEGVKFSERLEKLEKLADFFIDDKNIKVLEHFEVNGYDEAKAYHDLWVQQGYEGAILRDPTKEYKFGGRDMRMIKLKEFREEDFKIIGYKLGLRGAEDMTFILEIAPGITVDPKPIGNRALKERYVQDFEKRIKGKKGTLKFFYYTEDGVPFLPVFKCVRDYE